jgi:predicted MPP superfamily phosphohydrolase
MASALTASVGIWLFLVNRIVIHWVDGPGKTATIALLVILLASGALLSAWRKAGGKWFKVWLAVLVVFGIGELRRAWLRWSYHADSAHEADLWHPVTTRDLAVRHFELAAPALATDRIRVLHLSDLHVIEGTRAFDDRVWREMRAIDPDVIVMTGDYVSRADRLPLLESWLRGLPRARYGAYAVLGNHDYWTGDPGAIRDALTGAGVRMVGGDCLTTDIGNGRALRLCGTEEPWGRGYRDTLGADDSPGVAATLILSHTPDNVYAIHQTGVTALFAGHTHGGQFRLPLLGALVVPSRYGRRFDEGHFVVGGMHLFVSAGVGADAPALRLWCPPELVVVDLAAKATGDHRT